MGNLNFLSTHKTMSSEKISQELLEQTEEKLLVVQLTINEIGDRRSYYINSYGGPEMIFKVLQELNIDKIKLIAQIDALERFLNS